MAYSRRLDLTDTKKRKFKKGDLYTTKHNKMVCLYLGNHEAVVLHSPAKEIIGTIVATKVEQYVSGEKEFILYEGEVVLSNESF